MKSYARVTNEIGKRLKVKRLKLVFDPYLSVSFVEKIHNQIDKICREAEIDEIWNVTGKRNGLATLE